jgi:hypothetical protein
LQLKSKDTQAYLKDLATALQQGPENRLKYIKIEF